LPTKTHSKETLETCNDAADKLRHMVERFKNRLTSDNLRLSERYINSELKVLVASSLVSRSGDVRDFIACYQRAKFSREVDCYSFPDAGLKVVHGGSDCQQDAMLVDDIEIVEMQERIVRGHVRLYSTESFCRARANHLYVSLAAGGGILLDGLANREIRVPVRSSAASLNELPNKMVQRTSQIVDCVTNNKCDVTWDGIDAGSIEGCVLNFGYRVRLGSDCIGFRFPENVNPSIQVYDVLFGPFNFEADSVDSVQRSHSS
jgi:hypothetical protein